LALVSARAAEQTAPAVSNAAPAAVAAPSLPSVFRMPALQETCARLLTEVTQKMQRGEWDAAEKVCAHLIEVAPFIPEGIYNMACIQARQGKTEAAFASLATAIERGFDNAPHIQHDADL